MMDKIVMVEMAVLLALGIVLALAVLRRVLRQEKPPDLPKKAKREKMKVDKRTDDLFKKIAEYNGGVVTDDDK